MFGCLTMVVVFIILGVAGILGARYGYKKLVSTYTSPAAAQLPAVTYTDQELQSLTNRLGAFQLEANALTNEVTLTLSAHDINVLIHSEDELKGLRDKIYVEVDKDTIKSAVSMPLDGFGLEALKGRYLNGKAGLKVAVTNGKLTVNLDSLEVNGTPVSASFMTQLKSENLAKDIDMGPEGEKLMKRVESLTIENGDVILKLKPAPQPPNNPATTNAAPAGVI
jgi:hypothetical protein